MHRLTVSAMDKNRQSFEQKLTGMKEHTDLNYLGGKRKSVKPQGQVHPWCV